MRACAVETADVEGVLNGAQFADSFAIMVEGASLTARRAAESMFGRRRLWLTALLKVRDAAVKPFGLQTTEAKRAAGTSIGIFPVVSETPQRLVAGFDDKHLDFRVIVDVSPERAGTRVVVTSLVLKHNRLGQIYLAVILPFHRVIVRSMLDGLVGAPADRRELPGQAGR